MTTTENTSFDLDTPREGLDKCQCGSKYWDGNYCHSCGARFRRWFDTGRDLDAVELKYQLGRDLFAISGGRMTRIGPSAIDLPVSSGYRVRITLAADDTYTVERVMRRGTKEFRKGAVTGVYADQVQEVAYVASCYKNLEFGQ